MHVLLFVERDAAAGVFDLYDNRLMFLANRNDGGIAAGVTMNVGETFLDHAEYGDFHLVGEPAKLGWNLYVDLDAASF